MTINEYFKDWLDVIDIGSLNNVIKSLNKLYKNKIITPDYKDIFKAFTLCERKDCKVVFIGQDVYPQKGVATGVAFGNRQNTKELSPSLEVLKETVISDATPYKPIHFDITLEDWGKQGILLLNSALTCEVNKIGSHLSLWRPFVSKLLNNLRSNPGLIYVLFGRQAQSFEYYIDKQFNTVIKVNHPAYYARINAPMPNDVFKTIDKLLVGKYGESINWFNYL